MKVKLGDVCDKGSSNLKQSDVINQNGQYPVYGAAGLLGNIDSYHQDKPYVAVVKDGAGIGRVTLQPGYSSVIGTLQYLLPKENVLPEYLYYVTKHMHLEKYYTGATIPHIYFKDYKNEKFNLDAIEKQQRIVDILKKIENIIESRQQELQKLDDLIRARFVEMFGNPLDKSKANMYFVECVEFNPKKSEVKDLMCETVSFVPMECVGADGSFKIKEDGLVKDYYKGYTYFKNGDVLLAKITPCFENGKVAIAENCTNGIGFGTTEFHVSRPIPGVSNSQWIKYMLKNEHVHELATINMTGSAGQKRIQTPFFEKLKVYLPPIELQNQFADFVSQIDKSKLLSGCRLFHSWAPENRDKPKHVGVPRRETKDLRGGRRQQ